MSSVLQCGLGKIEHNHPLMMLGLYESNRQYWDYPILKHTFQGVCVCVTYSPLKKVIIIFIHDYGASTLLQILHQSFFSFIDGYVH
jgi:hypothetical protein